MPRRLGAGTCRSVDQRSSRGDGGPTQGRPRGPLSELGPRRRLAGRRGPPARLRRQILRPGGRREAGIKLLLVIVLGLVELLGDGLDAGPAAALALLRRLLAQLLRGLGGRHVTVVRGRVHAAAGDLVEHQGGRTAHQPRVAALAAPVALTRLA